MKVFPYCNTDLKCQYLPATNYDSCKCVDLERDLICFFSRSTALSALSNITTCFQVHKFLITYERTIFAEARVVFFVNDKVRTLPPPALVYFSLLRRVVGFKRNIAFTTIPPQANDGHPVKRMHRHAAAGHMFSRALLPLCFRVLRATFSTNCVCRPRPTSTYHSVLPDSNMGNSLTELFSELFSDLRDQEGGLRNLNTALSFVYQTAFHPHPDLQQARTRYVSP
jgi:hypothetical protein